MKITKECSNKRLMFHLTTTNTNTKKMQMVPWIDLVVGQHARIALHHVISLTIFVRFWFDCNPNFVDFHTNFQRKLHSIPYGIQVDRNRFLMSNRALRKWGSVFFPCMAIPKIKESSFVERKSTQPISNAAQCKLKCGLAGLEICELKWICVHAKFL